MNTLGYECGICGKKYIDITGLQSHISSDIACDIYKKKTIECENCGKKFTSNKGKKQHLEKSCLHGKKNIKTVKEILIEQQEEINKLKEIIEKKQIKRKPGRPKKVIETNTNNINNNNTNILGNNNTNIGKQEINNKVIINFGHEDIGTLTMKEKEKILNKAWLSIVELIKVLHCNEKRPESRNISITNLRSNDIYVYENGKFRTKNKDETINDLIQVRAGDIQELMEDYEGELKEKTKKAIINLLELINEKDEYQIKRTNEDVVRLIYDENSKIK